MSAGSADSVVNAAFDLALRADATIDHCRLQNLADAASCFDTLIAHVGERATYRLRTVTLGGLASRSTIFVKLAGRAARCELTAGSIANGIQTHDVFAEIEHADADTVTRELYRGIATDRGKLGFNGKMIVRESAPGADSDQSLKTLLTGTGAEASIRPQLEIYTDKVRAKHGATTGKLDEQMLFYLLSRGIDRRTAQTLLQWAFIEDAISRMDCLPLRTEIEQLVAAQLNEVSALEGLLGAMNANPAYDRLRRATRVARLPHPRPAGARQAAGVPRQRRLVAAPGQRHRGGRRLRKAASRQRASRRAPAEPGSHRRCSSTRANACAAS